jgi:hypothetical protein
VPVWLTRFLLRARATVSRRHHRELRDELHLHLRLLEEEHAAKGVSPDEARQRARREFGNAVAYQEASHDLFSFRVVEDLVQDLRYAIREMRRSAGFTCVAVASLAVGIGSLTTTFSIIDAFMLRGLPVHDAKRLLAVSTVESATWERCFAGHAVGQPTDIWIALARQPELNSGSPNLLEGRAALQARWLRVVGRLRANTGAREATVSANLIYQRFLGEKAVELGDNSPDVMRDRKQVVSLLSATTGFAPERAHYARPMLILSGITGARVPRGVHELYQPDDRSNRAKTP